MGRGSRQPASSVSALDELLAGREQHPRWAADLSRERWARDREGYWRDWLQAMDGFGRPSFYADDGEQVRPDADGIVVAAALRGLALGVHRVSISDDSVADSGSLRVLWRDADEIALEYYSSQRVAVARLPGTALEVIRPSQLGTLHEIATTEGPRLRLRLSPGSGPPVCWLDRKGEQMRVGPWSASAVRGLLGVVGPQAPLASIDHGDERLQLMYCLPGEHSEGREYQLSYQHRNHQLRLGFEIEASWTFSAAQLRQLPRL